MKHTILSAVLLAGTILAGTPALAETIGVADGQSIQAAIDRARAGDTIVVGAGTYTPFQITKDGITVRSEVKGGAHVIASGDNQPAVASYGQSNVAILGFRLTSRRGDGMKIGGSPGKMASNITVEDNIVESAALDGIKAFQAERMSVNDNEIKASGVSGAAGSSGNRNGDGGIDWVTVNNSEMTGNTVSSRGWACAMVKTGSNGNDISGNRFANCEVNGLDMAAGSDGAAAAANTSGKVAYNNRVEGNQIAAGRGCVIALHETSTNNRISGNQSSGRDCGDPTGGTNNQNAAVDTSNSGSSGGSGNYSSASGGGGMDKMFSNLGDVVSGACSTAAAVSGAMGAAGTVVSVWNGGKATAPLQIAQLVQDNAQLVCQQQMLLAQIRMLAGMDLRTADDVLGVLNVLDPILRDTGLAQPVDNVLRQIGIDYPTVFGGGAIENMEDQVIIWDDRTRKALDQKTKIEAVVIQEQRKALQRAGQIEQAGRASGGLRGAQLATNALLTEVMGTLNNQITATVAHQKALAEVQYREEAKRESANTMAADFMSSLAKCDNCKSAKPLLGN